MGILTYIVWTSVRKKFPCIYSLIWSFIYITMDSCVNATFNIQFCFFSRKSMCNSGHTGLALSLPSPTQAWFIPLHILAFALFAKPTVSYRCLSSSQVLPVFQRPAQDSSLQWSIPRSMFLFLALSFFITSITPSDRIIQTDAYVAVDCFTRVALIILSAP